ncbi:MAG: pilus assembly protein [Verrucomicrobia bacterium]|nr:pilus assembly protein [Verrucomicrobiota bacterium]MDE3098306.1 pilus assembly protein [Verrucomicrobiota bacterium]
MKGIADTGFLVAFVSRNDFHHDWAEHLARQWEEPFLTCESVLSETAFHLGSSRAIFEMPGRGFITPAFNCNDRLQQLENLDRRYADRGADFADLCLIRMSELFPKYPVITPDRDEFRVYRRNKREVIPLICPPE